MAGFFHAKSFQKGFESGQRDVDMTSNMAKCVHNLIIPMGHF